MIQLANLLLILVLSTACIKTAEQVHREKRFENMSEQMKDSQGLVADMVSQMKDIQAQLDKMNGRLEEIEHNQKKVDPSHVAKMNESINLLKTQSETQSAQLLQIQNEMKEQRAFIEKVTTSLSTATKSQKKSEKNNLEHGLDLIKKDSYADARAELEPLVDDKMSPGDNNKVLFGLGKVEYFTKNYDKALVYFSKIFTKYPKSSLAPASLLFIGRALDKMGKKDEAKEAFSKVVAEYPASKEAKEAKKAL